MPGTVINFQFISSVNCSYISVGGCAVPLIFHIDTDKSGVKTDAQI